MFSKTSWVAVLATTFALAGCGRATEVEVDEGLEARADLATLGGKADVPSWLRHIPVDWACGQTLKGKFAGWDSAHLYSFPGKVGYRYTFSFNAKYSYGFGAVVAVYDADTGRRVAFARTPFGSKATVEYTAEKSIKYLVAVYSVSFFASGKYDLAVQCDLTGFCVEWETLDENGQPLRNFYAQNVKTYADGKQLLAQVGAFINEDIKTGPCDTQSTACLKNYAPVCADTPAAGTTYGNVCEFKAHVRSTAGAAGQWKGHWDAGPCHAMCGGIAGFQCPAGQKCILDGSYPDAAGSCFPIVCNFDGNDYAEGESFGAGDGCNTCSCSASGMVMCSKRMCPACDPQKEWYRKYVVTDAAQCALVKFSCPVNTAYFSNACGCGCEQDKSCPEWFNCMPPATCDVKQLAEQCPYTQIAW